ncbi:hypothetical protein PHLCEN_2v8501 [Hermanssonia centrifuga]|uniref:Uncharacterized protein n=1 Tax=Hermanssonia centrifuga TaxID=98765 RepID=A0A2R6NTG3_9APHY|nr:hypothetical protein PHLCEN_2v8501 [Hermanssonia centrifuga]
MLAAAEETKGYWSLQVIAATHGFLVEFSDGLSAPPGVALTTRAWVSINISMEKDEILLQTTPNTVLNWGPRMSKIFRQAHGRDS